MSTIHETIHTLEEFNKWRRGNDMIAIPEPFEVGVAIGDAVRLLREHVIIKLDVERLKKDNSDMGTWIGAKMYEPEWDSFKKSLEVIDHWKTRAEKAEADTARLDWLLARNVSFTISYQVANGGGVWVATYRDRAAIDTAMKEDSK